MSQENIRPFSVILWSHLVRTGTGRVKRAYSHSGFPLEDIREERVWQIHRGKRKGCHQCGKNALRSRSKMLLIAVPSLLGITLFLVSLFSVALGIKLLFS